MLWIEGVLAMWDVIRQMDVPRGWLVLLVCVPLSWVYSRVLDAIHDVYAPDHIDKTVIAGVSFMGITMFVLAWLDVIPLVAPIWLFFVAIAWGMPILYWQRQQRIARRKKVEGR
jgi:hypothetical protein